MDRSRCWPRASGRPSPAPILGNLPGRADSSAFIKGADSGLEAGTGSPQSREPRLRGASTRQAQLLLPTEALLTWSGDQFPKLSQMIYSGHSDVLGTEPADPTRQKAPTPTPGKRQRPRRGCRREASAPCAWSVRLLGPGRGPPRGVQVKLPLPIRAQWSFSEDGRQPGNDPHGNV